MGAWREATTGFLTHLPQDSRAPPVEGLTWVSSCACMNILYKQSLTRSVKWFPCTCTFGLSLALTCAFQRQAVTSSREYPICLHQCMGAESRHFSQLPQQHIQINHILTLLTVTPADWWSAGSPHCQGCPQPAASEGISGQCCSRHNRPGSHGRESDWPAAACHEGCHSCAGRAQQPC